MKNVNAILAYLGVSHHIPSLVGIDALVQAYTRRIPWESISRIARRSRVNDYRDAHLMPDAFWHSAMTNGTGGTCYESNYAFFTLLRHLGYDGYLTLNNMRDKIACHSAIIIQLDNIEYLIDVGMPFHVAIPIHPDRQTMRRGEFDTHIITPQGGDVYLIERAYHPVQYCYHLIKRPVAETDYQQVLIDDYGDGGLFLDRAIIVKVIHEHIWRFDSNPRPFQIEIFAPFSTDKAFQFLGNDVDSTADRIAYHYGISAAFVKTTLEYLITSCNSPHSA